MTFKRLFFAVILLTVLSSSLQAQSLGVPTWKVYYDSAQLFWNKDWKKTIPLLAHAERSALSDLGIYDENYLTIVNDLGLAYTHTREYSTAEKLFTKVIATRTELGSTSDTEHVNTVINLADVCVNQGNFQKASKLYKNLAGSPAITAEDRRRVAENLMRLYESTNKLDSALLVSDRLKTMNNNGYHADDVNLSCARLYRKLRKYEEAGSILERLSHSLKVKRDSLSQSVYIRTLQEQGLLSLETGSLGNAEKYLLQSFRLLKASQGSNLRAAADGDNLLLIEVLNNLASTYERLNINDKALVYYRDALALCLRVNGADDISSLTIKSNIAGIHLRQGELTEAIGSYEEIANSLAMLPGSTVFYITVLNNLATAYRKSDQTSKAMERLNEARKLIASNNLEREDLSAVVLNNMAVLHTALGDPEKAITFFEKAYTIKESLFGENSVALMDIAGNMAVVYWALKKPDVSIPLFRKSIAMAIRQIKYIFPNLSEAEQIQFYQRTKEDFERFNAVAFQSSNQRPELLQDVFNNQVILKSILFFTQQHRQDLINQKRDSLLMKQHEQLRSKREQLGRFYQLSLKDLATAETSAATLEKEIDQLEKAISVKTSETVSEKMMEMEIRWNDIQKAMRSDQALIELIRFRKYDLKTFVENSSDRVRFGFADSVFYAGLITTSETVQAPQLVLFRDGNNMETRFLNYYRNTLTYYVEDKNSYVSYWKPFEQHITTKTNIYLSGDGVYHRLNLNTLRQPETGEYLLQHYDIHHLLNPGQFIQERTASTSAKKAVLVGDPFFDKSTENISEFEKFPQLPGSHQEVVRINDVLKANGWTTKLLLQKSATEKSIKEIRSPDLLHIATHGFFSLDQVKLNAEVKKDFLFYSGLALAGANKNITEEEGRSEDDGILTAFEVMNLDLSSTNLVVLSACETGLGKIENGEGVYGLQRSFLQAGARNIMISLWKVDDTLTQELMVQFYKNVFKGQSVRAALKQAQLDQIKKTGNPLGWGGFVVVGFD